MPEYRTILLVANSALINNRAAASKAGQSLRLHLMYYSYLRDTWRMEMGQQANMRLQGRWQHQENDFSSRRVRV